MALSSQVVHLQSEIMQRGQLSGQLHEQLQDLPSSYINGRASLSDPVGAIPLKTSTGGSQPIKEAVSPSETSGAAQLKTLPEQGQAAASPAETDDQARQPGTFCLCTWRSLLC